MEYTGLSQITCKQNLFFINTFTESVIQGILRAYYMYVPEHHGYNSDKHVKICIFYCPSCPYTLEGKLDDYQKYIEHNNY